jgi:ferredoxin-nitrite reductase
VWFRLGRGGITGHQDIARPTGVVVKPEDAVGVADAIVRVFIDHGDRTDRKKARLKYVLDAWGFDKFLAAVDTKLGKPLTRVPAEHVSEPNRQHRQAHIGVHAQKQPGVVWIGVALPVGRMTAAQMTGLAHIARELGDGDIRLTVWQNLLISGVAEEQAGEVERRLQAIGLTARASSIRAGLVACTGNTGCKFALSNTKDTAMAIAAHVESQLSFDTPINVHLTGCPNSCAQHYIGDIGLLACRVPVPDSDDTVEGFHVHVGGGFGADAAIAHELYRDVKVEDCPALITRMLAAYLANREGPAETFMEFSRRLDSDAIKRLVDAQGASA